MPSSSTLEVAPSSRGFVSLLQAFRATGGMACGQVVGQLFDKHRAGSACSLAQLVNTGQIFGFKWRSSLWIPMFQFEADNFCVKCGPQKVRSALPAQWQAWTVASWFATPYVMLDGQRPVDAFDTNLGAVMCTARSVTTGLAQSLSRQVAPENTPQTMAAYREQPQGA
jgi:hypothetical protein